MIRKMNGGFRTRAHVQVSSFDFGWGADLGSVQLPGPVNVFPTWVDLDGHLCCFST